MAYTKPDFTFNDENHAVIRFNRECVVELTLTPDRTTVTQYGLAITVFNELTGDVYGNTENLPIIEGPDVPPDPDEDDDGNDGEVL